MRRKVVDCRQRDHEDEDRTKPRSVNRQGKLGGLDATIRCNVDDLDRFDGPEADRRLQNEQTRKQARTAGYGQEKQGGVGNCPVQVESPRCPEQNDQTLRKTSDPFELEFLAKDLEGGRAGGRRTRSKSPLLMSRGKASNPRGTASAIANDSEMMP